MRLTRGQRRDAHLRVGLFVGLLLGMTFGAGCAGQLELPTEAYSNAQPSTEANNGKGSTPASGGSWGSNGPAAKPDAGGGQPTGYGPSADDAAVAVDTGGPAWPAPDTAPAGEPGPTPDAGAPPATTPTASACPAGVDALSLLARRCGGCHGERMPAKNLDLVSAGIATRMVGAKSTCNNKPLLDPNAPANAPAGHFIDKMLGPVAGCGAQMPVGTAPIVGAERDCLIEWAGQAITRAKGRM